MLRNHTWKAGYSPENGDLEEIFYLPALEHAKYYYRSTGYFTATSLTLISRGIETLVENQGKMRILVGCTLEEAEIEAIAKGEELQPLVSKRLSENQLEASNPPTQNALELLAWMVANQFLKVKVVVPFDSSNQPIADYDAIFHPKEGLIEDIAGDRIAWNGSMNETAAGVKRNWETISVFTEWESKHHFNEVANSLDRMWNGSRKGQGLTWKSMDIPEALKLKLLKFLPKDEQLPKRLQRDLTKQSNDRSEYWKRIEVAPTLAEGGERVGEATANVEPWQHQTQTFLRLYRNWPPRILIADEVGLGKTIQAGLLIRQVILAKKAKRILILVPKAVERQWQIELREKFNLNIPIFERENFTWYAPRFPDREKEQRASKEFTMDQSIFLMSSQLARRQDWADALLQAPSWDLVVLDEAHHARRRASKREEEDRPNALLKLMRELKSKTAALLLLTATPMQVDPLEVWELLSLLGLPNEWTRFRFKQYFVDASESEPLDKLKQNVDLFRATEASYLSMERGFAKQMTSLTNIGCNKVLNALRDRDSKIPLNRLNPEERLAALKLIRSWSPIRHRISRHTRVVLRSYVEKGVLRQKVARRDVRDVFIQMSNEERRVYRAVETYIETSFKRSEKNVRNAVGFVMTVYRRRVASSFQALRKTLERRSKELLNSKVTYDQVADDVNDDELDQIQSEEEVKNLQKQSLVAEEISDISKILSSASALPSDSKLSTLIKVIENLKNENHHQVMVFTQFTDTMDFLRTQLLERGLTQLLCYSGRGGEVPNKDCTWQSLDREQAKERFRIGNVEIFLCTEAAAEGLNFQFCGALVNYDMPWNPMRVEQRIGRIDRVGQQFDIIKVINLHYENTIETDVYRVLRKRINLFQEVVGPLQPILARLPGEIKKAVLTGERKSIDDIPDQIEQTRNKAFDLDTIAHSEMDAESNKSRPAIDFKYLERALEDETLLPSGVNAIRKGVKEFHIKVGTHDTVRVTTNPSYYEAHSENIELWSPGGTTFEMVKELVIKKDAS